MKIFRTAPYLRALKGLNATMAEISAMEQAILADPLIGALIPGLKGIRKTRFRMAGRGKRGGGRAIYYVAVSETAVVMLLAYAKSQQEDLTPDQKRAALNALEDEL